MEFVGDEGDEADDGHAEQGEDTGRGPAAPGSFDDGVGGAGEDRGDDELTYGVEPSRLRCPGLGDVRRAQRDPDAADRDVHPKNRLPPDAVYEQPAHDRPHRQRDPHDGAPESDGASSLAIVFEGVADDGHGDRVQHRSPNALKHPEEYEVAEAGGQAAGQ